MSTKFWNWRHVFRRRVGAVELTGAADELERRPLEPRGDVALERFHGAAAAVERPARRRFDKDDGLLCLFDPLRLDAECPARAAVGERGERVVGAADPLVVQATCGTVGRSRSAPGPRAAAAAGDVDDVVREPRRPMLAALAAWAAERE